MRLVCCRSNVGRVNSEPRTKRIRAEQRKGTAMTEKRAGMLKAFEDGVAILSFNRPEKHNAGAGDPEAWDWALNDPDVRCVVVRGEGRSFHTGRDTTLLGTREGNQSDYEFVRQAV